jgi:hypothetical protein
MYVKTTQGPAFLSLLSCTHYSLLFVEVHWLLVYRYVLYYVISCDFAFCRVISDQIAAALLLL